MYPLEILRDKQKAKLFSAYSQACFNPPQPKTVGTDAAHTSGLLSEAGHPIQFSKKDLQFLKLHSCVDDTEHKKKENALKSQTFMAHWYELCCDLSQSV